MSISNFANKNTSEKELGYYYKTPYINPVELSNIASSAFVRNPAWLALPAVSASENKIVALHAVFPEGNFCAFTITGSYIVNWGDGVTENYSASQTAYHNYDYNSASLSGTNKPVTFQAIGDTVTLTTHSYVNGSTISFYSVETGTAITSSQMYYVVNAATNTFQLATGSNGPAIDITSNISGSILEYKQAIITITPAVGANFNTLNFQVKYTGADALAANLPAYTTGFLDMTISAPIASSFTFGGLTVIQSRLQNIKVLSGNFPNISNLFSYCYSLQVVDLSGITANINNMNNTFAICTSLTDIKFAPTSSANTTLQNCFDTCRSLVSIPFFDTSGVTNWASAFNSCSKLITIPLIRVSGNLSLMFNGCNSLQYIPLLDTSNVTNMSSMFVNCYALQYIPLLDTSNVTNMSSMFSSCTSLKTVPLLNTSKVTTVSGMFTGCNALETVPLFDTRAVTDFSSMFSSCFKINNIAQFNTVSGSNMSTMFSTCRSLTSVPLFDTRAVTTMASMFTNCADLVTVPLFDTRAVTSMASMFSGCSSIRTIPLFNTSNVTNMAGMFGTCLSLTSIPPFNTVSVTSVLQMFRGSSNLQNVPFLNTANCTDINRLFEGCSILESIPLLNTAKVTNFDSAFSGCSRLNYMPALNYASASSAASLSNTFNACSSLSKNDSFGHKFTLNLSNQKMSSSSLETLFNNIASITLGSPTLTISTNYGAPTAITSTASTNAGSTGVSSVTTSSLAVGMQVTGTNTALTTPVACTFPGGGNLVSKIAHGLSNGDEVSFATIVTTTGIIINTIYYVVNAATDTFQVAATIGGAALTLTSSGTGTLRYRTTIASIGAGTITLNRPATGNGATTLSFRTLKTGTALLKGWTVSG